jgi:hypothetical protein
MLRAAFGGIVALVLASQILGYLQGTTPQDTVAAIEDNAVTSIQLIGQMSYDVQRKRILIDRHIFEDNPPQMAAIERQIAEVDDDYASAARAYAPLAIFEGEAARWFALTSDVAIAEQQAIAALRLSRVNRDSEASQVLIAAEPVLEEVSRDVEALIELNQAAATQARGRATELEASAVKIRLGLAIAILLITLVIGQLTRIISGHADGSGSRRSSSRAGTASSTRSVAGSPMICVARSTR